MAGDKRMTQPELPQGRGPQPRPASFPPRTVMRRRPGPHSARSVAVAPAGQEPPWESRETLSWAWPSGTGRPGPEHGAWGAPLQGRRS